MKKEELHGPLRDLTVNTWASRGNRIPELPETEDVASRVWTRPDPLVVDLDNYTEYVTRGYNTVIPRQFIKPDGLSGIDGRAWIELSGDDFTDPCIYGNFLPDAVSGRGGLNLYISLDSDQRIAEAVKFIRKLRTDWGDSKDLHIVAGPVVSYSNLFILCGEKIDYIIIRDPAGPDIQEKPLLKKLTGSGDAAGIISFATGIKDNTGFEGHIIIDGACTDIHDIVIAICLGMDGVMLRDVFASCIESPGKKLTKLLTGKSAMQTLTKRMPERYLLSNIHNMENFRIDRFGCWTADYTDEFYKERFKNMKNPPGQKNKKLGELWKKASDYERDFCNRNSIRIDKTLDGWTADLRDALFSVMRLTMIEDIGWLGCMTEITRGY